MTRSSEILHAEGARCKSRQNASEAEHGISAKLPLPQTRVATNFTSVLPAMPKVRAPTASVVDRPCRNIGAIKATSASISKEPSRVDEPRSPALPNQVRAKLTILRNGEDHRQVDRCRKTHDQHNPNRSSQENCRDQLRSLCDQNATGAGNSSQNSEGTDAADCAGFVFAIGAQPFHADRSTSQRGNGNSHDCVSDVRQETALLSSPAQMRWFLFLRSENIECAIIRRSDHCNSDPEHQPTISA